jgi:hypothetical protein
MTKPAKNIVLTKKQDIKRKPPELTDRQIYLYSVLGERYYNDLSERYARAMTKGIRWGDC